MKKSFLNRRTSLLALAFLSVEANAQTTPGLRLPAQSDEIVVTAQKRPELQRDVPQSLVVLKGETLTNRGVHSVEDLVGQFPGVTTYSFGGSGQSQINIRGITVGFDTASTVATYIDDVPFGSGSAYSGLSQVGLELGSFDVQRVELLRGPQGTLYGATAMGGLLKYVLTPPDMQRLGATLQLEGSASDRSASYAVRGSINVPIVGDKVAIHISGLHAHDGGNVDNVAKGITNSDRDNKAVGRVTLEARPSDVFTLKATALAQKLDRDGSSEVYYDLATGKPIYGDFTNYQPIGSEFHQRAQLYSLNGDYDLGFAHLSATVGRQHLTNDLFQDGSEAYPLLFNAFFPINGAAITSHLKLRKTTAEVRLASSGKTRLEYIAGAYYTDEDILKFQHLSGYLDGVLLPLDLGTFDIPATYSEIAAYGDATYHFTPRFDATLGIRAARSHQKFHQIGTGIIATSNPGSAASDTVFTYLGTLRYHISDKNMLYARAANGYRPGGPNLVVSDPITGQPIGGLLTFKPDTLWNYEIGAKLSPAPWLTTDVSAFYIDWKDVQLLTARNGIGVFANGGTARSQGVEFALTARPTPVWTTSLTGAYIDAKFTEDVPDIGAHKGESLPNSARWSFTAETDYQLFKIQDLSGAIGASWRYLGMRKAGYDAAPSYPQYILPAFSTVDLRASLNSTHWSLDFYLKNLFDKRGQLSATTIFAFLGGPARVSVVGPRTFGLILTGRY